jgi:Holliday junction DNA helicase RuvA
MDKEAISVFENLKKVSGIGSKVARGVLSYMTPKDVCFAIANEDVALLNKVPGVGGKTAARIILELKDKILKDDKNILSSGGTATKSKTNTHETDAVLALKVLGYGQSQIVEAMEGMDLVGLRAEEVIKKTLGILNKNKR